MVSWARMSFLFNESIALRAIVAHSSVAGIYRQGNQEEWRTVEEIDGISHHLCRLPGSRKMR